MSIEDKLDLIHAEIAAFHNTFKAVNGMNPDGSSRWDGDVWCPVTYSSVAASLGFEALSEVPDVG